MEKRVFIFLEKEHEVLLKTKELYKDLFEGEQLDEMLEEVEDEINDLWEDEKMFSLNLESDECDIEEEE